ncbi:dihydroxyacetone kinase subunit DhaK [Macrococcoides caseolyticum]|uniref:dihydroxyacetone kinase subunit DhaK n=1 Tax=Macrococcoides caseolyticum TaxID=69966 RepID=UPI001061A04F|nr:dihydroxyacetone kinase subunit DhaK [Macrococcus caseolyticus]TDM19217.1 dihydroxyacetone kinase subunit DhaK [Macrococcus caseolyticus]VUC66865.1 dihydroxyacetone kinase subunit DhaK [Macrococcus caseolyticus]
MKKLLKEKTSFVSDMLKGMALTDESHEVVADSIIVRKEKKIGKVALVSGGGSGHEPAHAGYVAEGMLDAAVCGEVFTSPTPDKVLEAIKSVATDAGVLLIIKNYAGDVMNFEMAMELAEMEGIKVDRVIVRDDVVIENKEQRRGVAGTVIVHKVAGYYAEQGLSLEEIKSKVEALLPNIATIGMAIEPCMVPTTGRYGFDLADDEMEIGIGIHGEKGIYREKIEPIDKVIERLMTEIEANLEFDDAVVMLNGMGGTPLSELSVAAHYLDEYFKSKNKSITKFLVGNYMTALDMQGFSITVVKSDEALIEALIEALSANTKSKYFL